MKPVKPPKRDNSMDGYNSQGISASDGESVRLSNVKQGMQMVNIRKPAYASLAGQAKQRTDMGFKNE